MSFFGSDLIFRLIAFVLAIVVHEFGHALAALLLGDDTPKQQGRVSLNPLSHLDLLGLLMVLFVNFGWAKPVMFDPSKIRGNKSLGIILIALAGPAMNALLAVVAILGLIGIENNITVFGQSSIGQFIYSLLSFVAIINIALTVFNLIPIPPLDGWKVFLFLMPRRIFMSLLGFERIGPFILLFVLLVPMNGFSLGGLLINNTITWVLGWFGLGLMP